MQILNALFETHVKKIVMKFVIAHFLFYDDIQYLLFVQKNVKNADVQKNVINKAIIITLMKQLSFPLLKKRMKQNKRKWNEKNELEQ